RHDHAGVCDQPHEPAATFAHIDQQGQRVAMPHAQIEIARVRGDSEGLLTKSVKIKEHGSYLPPFGIAASTETFSNCSTSSAVRRVGSRKSARKAAPTDRKSVV